jgi:hypothetical protein
MTDGTNPFAYFEDHRRCHGLCPQHEKGLQSLLALVEAEFSKEDLEDAAQMLDDAGLFEAASLVVGTSKTAIPSNILNCPYDEQDRYNYVSWQAAYRRSQIPPRAGHD